MGNNHALRSCKLIRHSEKGEIDLHRLVVIRNSPIRRLRFRTVEWVAKTDVLMMDVKVIESYRSTQGIVLTTQHCM